MKKYKKRLNSLKSCRKYLADILNRLDSDELDPTKARTLIYGTATLGMIIEKADLEIRIAALEKKYNETAH